MRWGPQTLFLFGPSGGRSGLPTMGLAGGVLLLLLLRAMCVVWLPSHVSSGELWGQGGRGSRGLLHPIPGVWGQQLKAGPEDWGVLWSNTWFDLPDLGLWPSGLTAQSPVLRGPDGLQGPLSSPMQVFGG